MKPKKQSKALQCRRKMKSWLKPFTLYLTVESVEDISIDRWIGSIRDSVKMFGGNELFTLKAFERALEEEADWILPKKGGAVQKAGGSKEMWFGMGVDEEPLLRLNADEFMANFGRWISDDVAIEDVMKAVQRLLTQQNSGNAVALSSAEFDKITDGELWADCDALSVGDRPLFRLNAVEFWAVIGRWIMDDVSFRENLQKIQRLFAEYSISGAVVALICIERADDGGLIERMLKMVGSLTVDTMKVITDSFGRWLKTADVDALRAATPGEVAQLLWEFPVQNLKGAMIESEVTAFLKDPDGFKSVIKGATGWNERECTLICKVLQRRVSMTKKQILDKMVL